MRAEGATKKSRKITTRRFGNYASNGTKKSQFGQPRRELRAVEGGKFRGKSVTRAKSGSNFTQTALAPSTVGQSSRLKVVVNLDNEPVILGEKNLEIDAVLGAWQCVKVPRSVKNCIFSHFLAYKNHPTHPKCLKSVFPVRYCPCGPAKKGIFQKLQPWPEIWAKMC